MKAYTRLLSHLRKTMPDLQYAAVKEQGALHGMKHLHVIFFNWVWYDFDQLQATWLRLTGAHDVNIKRKKNEAIANYAAKYVGKGNVSARKVTTYSKGFPKLPKDKEWIVVSSRKTIPMPWEIEGEDLKGRIMVGVAKTCYHIDEIQPLSRENMQWLKSALALYCRPPPVLSAS